mmetsp:Transcript_127135/g.230969  ORF Transcript_127135/g.230969 Transcript_127135/m.230969 type:complete len:323 (-) Transcript_127135:158-1126(-)
MSLFLPVMVVLASMPPGSSIRCVHAELCPDSAEEGLSLVQLRGGEHLRGKQRAVLLSQIPIPGKRKVPPVHGQVSAKNAKKLGQASVIGSWANYYDAAEKDMQSQWTNFLLPMIRSSDFSSVLEVGAGACRNTEKLLPFAQSLLATDIDPTAVRSCKHRFASRKLPGKNLSFSVVDGVHLPVPDNSISLIYQFDSGVHFHREVIRRYLLEFQRVLRPGGTGFFHHSNLAASQYPVEDDEDITRNYAWRSNMSRALFNQYAEEAGLEVLCHPLVDWVAGSNLDSFARFRKPGAEAHAKALDADICPSHLHWKNNGGVVLKFKR